MGQGYPRKNSQAFSGEEVHFSMMGGLPHFNRLSPRNAPASSENTFPSVSSARLGGVWALELMGGPGLRSETQFKQADLQSERLLGVRAEPALKPLHCLEVIERLVCSDSRRHLTRTRQVRKVELSGAAA